MNNTYRHFLHLLRTGVSICVSLSGERSNVRRSVQLLQMTFFVACLVLTGRREAANRHCITLQVVKTRQECRAFENSPLLLQSTML